MTIRRHPADLAKQAESSVVTKPSWYAQAACAHLDHGLDPRAWDPDWFEAARSHETDRHEAARRKLQADRAIELCSLCPVRVECAAYGSINREWGVWGGVVRTTIPARNRPVRRETPMPVFEVTQGGQTRDIAARDIGEAAARAGDHPPVTAITLKAKDRAPGRGGMDPADQRRHRPLQVDDNRVGACPEPDCEFVGDTPGALRQHMLSAHDYAVTGEGKRG